MKKGIDLIAEERQRQISVEGYDQRHNAQHAVHENRAELKEKIKPKFNEGDWVVYDHCTYEVIKVPEKGLINYELMRNGNICCAPEPYIKKWTIQDAKDGDVITYKNDDDEWILIYKYIIPKSRDVPHDVLKYHALFTGTDFYDSGIAGMINENYASCFTPATTEQRDLLFSKMKEAGYEWDADKKELKNIEQKPAEWSEEDDQYLLVCKNALYKYQSTDKWDATIIYNWLCNRLRSLKN